MTIVLNGQEAESEAENLLVLWREWTVELNPTGFAGYATALNRIVIRADAWAQTRLQSGDRVEILRARSGG